MAVQVPNSIVHGGGSLTPKETKKLLCKAFRAAVKEYCDLTVGKRGSFNDIFFKKLNDPKIGGAALAGQITREVPKLVATGAAATPAAVTAATSSVRSAYAQALAKMGGGSGITGTFAGGLRSCFAIGEMFGKAGGAANFFRGLAAGGQRLRFPDGMLGNQVLEIKGPGDSFRPGLKADYDALSAPSTTIVVDCKSCNAAQQCKNGPSMAGGFSKGKGCK